MDKKKIAGVIVIGIILLVAAGFIGRCSVGATAIGTPDAAVASTTSSEGGAIAIGVTPDAAPTPATDGGTGVGVTPDAAIAPPSTDGGTPAINPLLPAPTNINNNTNIINIGGAGGGGLGTVFPPDVLTPEDAQRGWICDLRAPAEDRARYVALGPVLGESKQIVIPLCNNPTFAGVEKTIILQTGKLLVAEAEGGGMIKIDVSKDNRPGGFKTDRYPRLETYFPGKKMILGTYNNKHIPPMVDPLVFQLPRSSTETDFCSEVRKEREPPPEDQHWARTYVWDACKKPTPHKVAVAQTVAAADQEWLSKKDGYFLAGWLYAVHAKVTENNNKPVDPKLVDFPPPR